MYMKYLKRQNANQCYTINSNACIGCTEISHIMSTLMCINVHTNNEEWLTENTPCTAYTIDNSSTTCSVDTDVPTNSIHAFTLHCVTLR